MKYIIITPAYNEEKYLRTYIDSVINQTLKPQKLLFVDDNSNDTSAEIIKEYCTIYDWIEYIYHPSMPVKVQGSKVIEAFNYGLSKTDIAGIDFICKIDADLLLPGDYFEQVAAAFNNDKKLGICGGIILELKDNQWISKKESNYHTRGALKAYKIQCFTEIDGLMPTLGWDGLDEMKALYSGWETRIIDVGVKHLRPTSSDYNPVVINYKYGIANFKNGGNLFLALIRTIKRAAKSPYLICGVSFLIGYLNAYIHGIEKNVDKSLSKFINKFHLRRLLNLNR